MVKIEPILGQLIDFSCLFLGRNLNSKELSEEIVFVRILVGRIGLEPMTR
ncbi:MAG: hypothetical protein K0R12_432 [Gammaproteobacteria bacterium]|jgi:hypothetical protein|nr:hypothetical protein [Gammaproteobacteria bacterium]